MYFVQRINISFIQDDVTISEVCAKGLNVRAIYELSYTTDSGIMCVVDGIECSDNTCRYKLQSNTADSRCQRQFSGESVTVSATARNIVGRSNSAMSGIISEFPPPIPHVWVVSEPDPRKIEKEGLAHRLGWKCTLRPVWRRTSDWLLISILMCVYWKC